MKYTDTLIRRYDDGAFQAAFREYFAELDCRVTNWDGLFSEMSETGQDFTWVRRDERGAVTGFIQFTVMDLESWFFTVKCGFIREFWIAPALRRQGHGTALLRLAEEWLTARQCAYALLTTKTAPQFYRRNGYVPHGEIHAKNQEVVFVKSLLK